MWVRVEDYQAVGQKLAEARKQAGWTQAELAKLLTKPQSFVSSYEIGQRRLDLLEFVAVAKALETDPSRLFEKVLSAFLGKRKPLRKSPKPGGKHL